MTPTERRFTDRRSWCLQGLLALADPIGDFTDGRGPRLFLLAAFEHAADFLYSAANATKEALHPVMSVFRFS